MSTAISARTASDCGIEAIDIEVRLSGVSVLRRVSLSLLEGRRVAVVGPNGCGKTTLIRALAGLVPCSSGEVRIDGRRLDALGRLAIARQIAYMPQQWPAVFPLTSLEAVLLGRSPHKRWLGLADRTDVDLARQAMTELEVWHLAARPITAISGGELQRLMFARALVQQGRYLLLDEPTSAQDPRGALGIMTMLATLCHQGKGVLAAVHDLNLALRFFDEVLVLKEGSIIGQGSPLAVLQGGALGEAFGVKLNRVGDPGSLLVTIDSLDDR